MSKADNKLTEEQWARLEAIENLPDDQIDYSDIPETTDWSKAHRGMFVVPKGMTTIHPSASTNTSERGLEDIICDTLADSGWRTGDAQDYDRNSCIDLRQLSIFLADTQPDTASALSLDSDTPTRQQFLNRLKREVGSRGVIDVLRNGVNHRQHHVDLFYGTPSRGNALALERHRKNRFTVTRQLRYSDSSRNLALDLALFVNGLPIATAELKNSLTKQTTADAVEQYKRSRNPRDDIFALGRCGVHFAADDQEIQFCTKLAGKDSQFLPFNKGNDGGAGNPPDPDTIKTDYLWRDTLTPGSLVNIIENYAQRVGNNQIWPRYHQLDVVRRLLAYAQEHGAGQKYLIQHSAGSGKSNSIAWLAHQLIGLSNDEGTIFDSTIVVTDRVVLDRQINDTIRLFTQVGSTVAHADTSRDLANYIIEGRKIIITTVQKFPIIMAAIGDEHRDRRFAIIIDEAHSSQGGQAGGAMNAALRTARDDEEEIENTFEDQVNRIIENRRLPDNVSFFAFTATPKNKTLELFGDPLPQPDGTVKHAPFHSYTMKQAIQEGFILDVLGNYTTVQSYFNLIKKIDDDPEFDSKRARKKLTKYIHDHQYAIQTKAEIIVDHFETAVAQMVKGKARAMVVTDGVERAINYYNAINHCLQERSSPHKAIVAFSGEREFGGQTVSESSLNGFPSNRIAEQVRQDPYRILVCADKFQTGYDEPLLHTMYVDKTLAGIKAVQTLSRLNRAHPDKTNTFVLDFMNTADTIRDAFKDYYRTTVLAEETDPDKLHDMKASLDHRQVYSQDQVDQVMENLLYGNSRAVLDSILDPCIAPYLALDEDGQVDFKATAKAFVRLYAFLSQVLPYANPEWEKLFTFLNLLIPRLPAPEEEDLSKGILEAVDIESYRAERQETIQIALADENAEIQPVPAGGGGSLSEPDMDPLSKIIADFNLLWGDNFTDPEQVVEMINRMPDQVATDTAYQNAKRNSDAQNARIEHDAALMRLVTAMLRCNTELYRQYTENPEFKAWLSTKIFEATYMPAA